MPIQGLFHIQLQCSVVCFYHPLVVMLVTWILILRSFKLCPSKLNFSFFEQAAAGFVEGNASLEDRVWHGHGADQPEVDCPNLGRGLVRRSSSHDGLLGQDHEVERHRDAGDDNLKCHVSSNVCLTSVINFIFPKVLWEFNPAHITFLLFRGES